MFILSGFITIICYHDYDVVILFIKLKLNLNHFALNHLSFY